MLNPAIVCGNTTEERLSHSKRLVDVCSAFHTLPANSEGLILCYSHGPCSNAASLETCFVQAKKSVGVEAPVTIPLGTYLFLNFTVLLRYFSKTVINQHPLLCFS